MLLNLTPPQTGRDLPSLWELVRVTLLGGLFFKLEKKRNTLNSKSREDR